MCVGWGGGPPPPECVRVGENVKQRSGSLKAQREVKTQAEKENKEKKREASKHSQSDEHTRYTFHAQNHRLRHKNRLRHKHTHTHEYTDTCRHNMHVHAVIPAWRFRQQIGWFLNKTFQKMWMPAWQHAPTNATQSMCSADNNSLLPPPHHHKYMNLNATTNPYSRIRIQSHFD